ncbi:MAG TPA: hypothetical protein VF586_06600 [Pyrinomonadaceae bacterium]|jgi:hypothetical protein
MAEFDDLREQLGHARDERDAAADALALARERLKRVAAREAELSRAFDPDNQRHQAERARLLQERDAVAADIARLRDTHVGAREREVGLWRDFAAFTDPREAIERWDDQTPILLMPVRLETRFKTAAVRGAAAPVPQLWVRVYPDDCWRDSFDPTLTETEVANARTYWIGIWKAGGVEEQERGAWSVLVNSHGSGRASWVVSEYQPTNVADRPAKPRAQDVVLTIATETPLTPAEDAAAATFWLAAWLADGDAAQVAAAQAALETEVGQERAGEIIAQYQPVNFAEPLAAGVAKSGVNASVSTVVFAPVPTRQNAWSRAPKFQTLPDRFVFIGYQGGKQTVLQIGNPVPSPLIAGPDPSAAEADQLRHDTAGNLVVPDELRWMTDFDRAVEVGMGFRINLDESQARGGFDRVLVIGLRVSADAEKAKGELESLLSHHSQSRAGLALVPQGTPTNNTEAVGSGFDRLDDPDRSFDDLKAPLFTPEADWLDKRDGQWLAEYLGVDPALFHHVRHAGATDQAAARAMNIALWPATLGYWMETMMAPVFTRDGIEQTRDFFNRYVVGGGAIPALRIGAQPYGVLPATALSRMRWMFTRRDPIPTRPPQKISPSFLGRLYPLLLDIDADWRAALADVSFVGKPGDPHQLLLDIVGLHPGSVEWSQRYAENLKTLFNRLNLGGLGQLILALVLGARRLAAQDLLKKLGAGEDPQPMILDKIFFGNHQELRGGVVDDKPLSESEPIRAYTAGGQNYVQWLIDAADTSLDALYRQDGFKDDKPPKALLYLLLRHALQLGYHDVSIRLHVDAGLYTAEAAARARLDDPFLHIRDNQLVSESRYEPLYAAAPAITGSQTQPVHQFIASQLPGLSFASYLREQLRALGRLKSEPTARLERAFADHVDTCSYRLDAWLLGLVNYQLALMRNLHDGSDAPARGGVYLGAYAWLEDLRPENKVLTRVTLGDPDLIKDFGGADEPPLFRDVTNQGYVHAPSLNHAVAAAVLRNGFVSNASPANRHAMAVNLTSERVRTALALLEGIREGQGLADLLGYQFERGLHDRHNLAEVDKFIFDLRRAFPLRADRLRATQTGEGVPIEAIEARNVIDGLALVEQIKASGVSTYPFGKPGLPPITVPAEADAINAEADRLLEAHDAVADLALSEGVYQAVLGNYDRVASTYDAYARGHFPPEPDVIRTPLNGIGLTHRVALHLKGGADPNTSPLAGLPMTPRAQAEPALNDWLATTLPPPENVSCLVSFRSASTGALTNGEVTLRDLGLQPADLVALIRGGDERSMSELDDRIVRHAFITFDPRPDAPVTISYLEKDLAPFSVFELMPLVRNVRRLTTQSRPLKATDLTLVNEAAKGQDQAPFVDIQRLILVRTAMDGLRADLATFQAQLEGPLSDLPTRRGEILSDVDQYVTDLAALLARAATFAVLHAGWGFAYDFKRRVFDAILQQAAELVARWDEKLSTFDDRMTDEGLLPVTAKNLQRVELLRQAERAISTATATPLPTDPDPYRTDLLNVRRPAFVAKRDQFANLQNTTRRDVSQLLTDVAALLPVTDFDDEAFILTAHEDEMVRFTEDAVAVVKVIVAELDRRSAASQDLFTQHGAAPDAPTAVRLLEQAAKTLLGSDFRIFPEFPLAAAQGDEFDNALNASRTGDLFQYLTNPPDPSTPPEDFPVDTWLYGLARVREKMHAWEQTVMFAGSLGRPEPDLDALQLPFIAGDRWLGLEFPPDQKLDQDRLLYTAHLASPFDKTVRQCGMLLDEWTETIPAADVDTGITFHHDRPNTEPPQVMLLVTPPEFLGSWRWDDLVDALHETLDFAKRRAVEPLHIDRTAYAPFLPATIMASQASQLTIAANLALNNRVAEAPRQG